MPLAHSKTTVHVLFPSHAVLLLGTSCLCMVLGSYLGLQRCSVGGKVADKLSNELTLCVIYVKFIYIMEETFPIIKSRAFSSIAS
ncbi:hypothetical protein EDD17DRAFT_1125929 [Pisolithus thermaeus]|nr:hypothetical protein EDD17DRAFT_1125929 [Pisolithus thermaeus]